MIGAPLFAYEDHVDPRRVHARTLLVTIGSFADPGHVQQRLDRHLLDRLASHELGHFDADQLIDYRDQRPLIAFQRDKFTDYQTPRITLHQVTDEAGASFLLLTGPEPSMRWEGMAAAVERIVDDHNVQLTVLVQSVPMPTPHTRPVLISRYASDSALLPGNQPMFGDVVMSSAFPTMLSLRLGETGHDVIGLAAHIPQYVADADYPEGALAVARAVRDATGLDLPTKELAAASGVVSAQIGVQVAQSEELGAMIAALEHQYDSFVRGRALTPSEEDLPSGDDLARAAEDFLKGLGESGDGGAAS